MKKTILVLLLTIAAMTAFSQDKKVNKDTVMENPFTPTDTLNVNITKIRYLRINTEVHDLQKEIPVFLTFQYIITAYDFYDNAKSGLSKKEIEQLQNPFKPYWDYYQKQLQQQKK